MNYIPVLGYAPNSPQNAEKFKQEFLKSDDKAENNPEIYPPEDELNAKRILS